MTDDERRKAELLVESARAMRAFLNMITGCSTHALSIADILTKDPEQMGMLLGMEYSGLVAVMANHAASVKHLVGLLKSLEAEINMPLTPVVYH